MLTLRFAALALAGIFLTGCGSDPDAPDANNGPAPSTATSETSQDIIHMTAEDGWVELHDLALPEPGRARLDIEGQTIEFEIECYGPGVVDHSGEVPKSLSSLVFNAAFSGDGTLPDGRRVNIEGSRKVHNETGMLANTYANYSYRGMDAASLELNVFDEEGVANGSLQGGPSPQNRAGEGLPMLHVQPDGSFTVNSELVSKAKFIPGTHQHHQQALAGPATLAGKCVAPWEELPNQFRW